MHTYPKLPNATRGESQMIGHLCTLAFEEGWSVFYSDGEGPELYVSNSVGYPGLITHLSSCEEEILRFTFHGTLLGSLFLVWGNESSGECLIADAGGTEEFLAFVDACQHHHLRWMSEIFN